MLIATILTLAALGVSGEPDGIVQTAPEGSQAVVLDAQMPTVAESAAPTADPDPHGLTTDEQIQRFLSQDAPKVDERTNEPGLRWNDDGEVHGYVEAGIGTGGYRSYGAAVSLPLGENGRISFSYRQTENDYRIYPYDRYHPYDAGYDSLVAPYDVELEHGLSGKLRGGAEGAGRRPAIGRMNGFGAMGPSDRPD